MDEEYVKVPLKTYERMMHDVAFLSCLRAHGVDNWQGYDDAVEDYYGDIDE